MLVSLLKMNQGLIFQHHNKSRHASKYEKSFRRRKITFEYSESSLEDLWSCVFQCIMNFCFVLSSVFSRELGTSSLTCPAREPSSGPHQPMPLPSGPLAYGGGAEGRKRRSPSSYKGKSSKASRPGGLESLFGKGNDGAGILVSGPESPRQVGGLQTATHRNRRQR